MKIVRLMLVLLLPLLAGCASRAPAPVEDRGGAPAAAAPVMPAATVTPAAADPGARYYTVKKGDTLYSIALDNGQDYKDVAAWNNLDNPNLIKIGQQLRVTPPSEIGAPVAVVKPIVSVAPIEVKGAGESAGANTDTFKRAPRGGKVAYSEEALAKARQGDVAETSAEAKPETRPADAKPAQPKPAEPIPAERPIVASDGVDWMWPAGGKPLAPFVEGSSKGIDIAGKAGDPVVAAAGGVVSYAGAGLRGYGNLVVLRHNATYLSVYAHNSKILVKEKQTVVRGQKIAEIGSTDAESPRLHFEIRREGKPADPQKYLPAR